MPQSEERRIFLLVPRGTNIAERDVDDVLAVVAEAALAEDAHPFGLPVVERLLQLVPSERGGYFEVGGPPDGSAALFSVQTVDLMWARTWPRFVSAGSVDATRPG